MKICKHCKKEFKGSNHSIYCSQICRHSEIHYRESLKDCKDPEKYADRMSRYLHKIETLKEERKRYE